MLYTPSPRHRITSVLNCEGEGVLFLKMRVNDESDNLNQSVLPSVSRTRIQMDLKYVSLPTENHLVIKY
jgi:hypothetical protein